MAEGREPKLKPTANRPRLWIILFLAVMLLASVCVTWTWRSYSNTIYATATARSLAEQQMIIDALAPAPPMPTPSLVAEPGVVEADHSHDLVEVASCADLPPQAMDQAAADQFITATRAAAAAFEDFAAAQVAGYTQLTAFPYDNGTWGPAHYLSSQYARDSVKLDPAQPESLIYLKLHESGDMVLLGVMFIVSAGSAPCPAGPLAVWHTHPGLCFDYWLRLHVMPEYADQCEDVEGYQPMGEMLHVWIIDQASDPLAINLSQADYERLLERLEP